MLGAAKDGEPAVKPCTRRDLISLIASVSAPIFVGAILLYDIAHSHWNSAAFTALVFVVVFILYNRVVPPADLDESPLGNGSEQSSTVFDDVPADVLSVTRELFPGDVSVRTLADPEYPGDSYVVIDASASGNVKEIEGRRLEWHARVRKFGPPGRIWRLSLTYLT